MVGSSLPAKTERHEEIELGMLLRCKNWAFLYESVNKSALNCALPARLFTPTHPQLHTKSTECRMHSVKDNRPQIS